MSMVLLRQYSIFLYRRLKIRMDEYDVCTCSSILKKLILYDHTDTQLHPPLSPDMFESRGSDWSKDPTFILIGAGVGEPQPSIHTELKD